jgi:hypothetical protein
MSDRGWKMLSIGILDVFLFRSEVMDWYYIFINLIDFCNSDYISSNLQLFCLNCLLWIHLDSFTEWTLEIEKWVRSVYTTCFSFLSVWTKELIIYLAQMKSFCSKGDSIFFILPVILSLLFLVDLSPYFKTVNDGELKMGSICIFNMFFSFTR